MPTLDWIGKDAVIRHHKDVPFRLLESDEKLSHGETDDGNLIVQGDNLHALKALLPKYAGKVKCIYIDPPYNTGNEGWVYNDNVKAPEIKKWLGDVVGKEAEDLSRHDKWLCMMYPRLVLLKQFLSEDGAIFVSIDDNEVASLRLLMDEVFGKSNFVEIITWNKRIPKNDGKIGSISEYIVIYSRNINSDTKFTMLKDGLKLVNQLLSELKKQKIPLKDAEKELQKLYRKHKFDRGITLYNRLNRKYKAWGKINMSWPNADTFGPRYNVLHPILKEPVAIPDRGWRWTEDTFKAHMEGKLEKLHDGSVIVGRVWFDSKLKTQPSSINYLEDVETILLRTVLSLKSDGGMEVEKIFGEKSAFSYPKPTNLIQILINSITSADDIILDSFAGSGTTGHAVLKQNAEDGGNRKFILVEMEENIADNITAERVRRVASGYTDAKGKEVEGLGRAGKGGFQFCRLSAEPLFDGTGRVREDISYDQLAEFVWFSETGSAWPGWAGKEDKASFHRDGGIKSYPRGPLIGTLDGHAFILLYNGILADRSDLGGNVLNQRTLDYLQCNVPHHGPMTVFAARCRFGPDKLRQHGIIYKQLPYRLNDALCS